MDAMPLDDTEQRVYEAVVTLERERRAGWLQEVADTAGLPVERTREVLAVLSGEKDLVQQQRAPRPGEPDLGPRFRSKERP